MSKKKKQKRRQPRKGKNTNAPARLRRRPAPRVCAPLALKPAGSRPEPDNPITAEIIRLHRELDGLTRRGGFQIWSDWLETTESWLKVVGKQGELGAMAELPAAVQQKFDELDRAYTRAAERRPAAYRQMGETFTAIHRLLADTYPFIDLEACGRMDRPDPDILGQAFLISLGSPRSWRQFLPGWPACVEIARQVIPDPGVAAAEVYEQLTEAHLRARLAGASLESPQPGEDESWAIWLEALRPYYEPLLLGPGLIFSSGMLLALAARFPAWIVRGGLVRFVWPDIEADPMLNRITSITAMLYGFNGFYIGKQQGDQAAIAAIAEMEAYLAQAAGGNEQELVEAGGPPPSSVFGPPPEQEFFPRWDAAPSFSDLFKTD